MKKFTLYIAAVFMFCSAATAQNLCKRIDVITTTPQKAGNNLNVEFLINYNRLYLSPTEQLLVTPMLVNGIDTIEMTPVIFTGNTKAKKDKRLMEQYLKKGTYAETLAQSPIIVPLTKAQIKSRKDCGTPCNGPAVPGNLTVEYAESIPYEPWMNGSRIMLCEELFGCSGYSGKDLFAIANYIEAVEPMVAFVIPEYEVVKLRTQQMSAKVTFKQGDSIIDPALFNNAEELDKIGNFMKKIQNNKDLSIQSITLKGYASPEGSYSFNTKLAAARSQSLKADLEKRLNINPNLIKAESFSEDWDSLKNWLLVSDWPSKDQLLKIINDNSDPNVRDAKIRALDNGKVYAKLLKDVYPGLRRVDYIVNYNVKPFTVETGQVIILTHPENMSLYEMYQVAESYDKNSPKYAEAYEIASRLYPNDPTANINMAAVAINARDLAKARKYLKRVAESASSLNNLGIVFALEGNYADAEKCFNKAIQMGSEEAAYNLENLYQLQ